MSTSMKGFVIVLIHLLASVELCTRIATVFVLTVPCTEPRTVLCTVPLLLSPTVLLTPSGTVLVLDIPVPSDGTAGESVKAAGEPNEEIVFPNSEEPAEANENWLEVMDALVLAVPATGALTGEENVLL